MAEVEIPSYFLCPISLEIMRDPVTLPTGITFDRHSIERWIAARKPGAAAPTCPVTKQPLPTLDLTPNHTVRSLIKSWCTANATLGVEPIRSPRPPVDAAHVTHLLDAACSPVSRIAALRQLREIVNESDANRRCVESSSSAVEFLTAVVTESDRSGDERDEALAVLCSLVQSSERLPPLGNLVLKCSVFLESLFSALGSLRNQSRAHAAILLRAVVSSASPTKLLCIKEAHLQEVVNVVRDRISSQATRAGLHVLLVVSTCGRNRLKAVRAGAVRLLVEILLEEGDKRTAEMALALLDKLCRCAEGRAELVGHAAGVAVVSKKVLRVSPVGSERAMRVLEKLCRFSATAALLQEMVEVGAVSKICLVLQVECADKAKEKAREMLKMHAGAWRNSRCLSPQFLVSYPAHATPHSRR
ncbi:hypothetical protein HPP92_000938 [Vanilla planifolia]|uniref:U-box domain-containing protein n=1 Tax=Vanilla planifolia TaxID=51239 RepID=A0A835S6Q5_VANPL|nr:hypothetical protein HPP92_000938 [Vanilla planifolia]